MVITSNEAVLCLEMLSDVEITGYKEPVFKYTKFSPISGLHTFL